MKNILLAACLFIAISTCSSAFAQCEGGVCAVSRVPMVRFVQRERIVVRSNVAVNVERPVLSAASDVVRAVATRPFFRGRRFGFFCRSGRCN